MLKTSRNYHRVVPPYNGYGGLSDNQVAPPPTLAPYGQDPRRIQYLLDNGTQYWLSTNLGLPSPAATTTVNKQTASVDNWLLIIGAQSNISLSTIQIQAQGTDNYLTNSATPISSIAGRSTLEPGIKYWARPYLLAPQTQLGLFTTGDGTETGGFLALICLKLPNGVPMP